MFKYLIFLPSASFAMRSLMRLMMGITAMLSLRGVTPMRIIVAPGAFRRSVSRMALTPRATSAALASASSSPRGDLSPTLFVPAMRTMTLGLTPSSSPWSRRQRMFCVVSPPQPKSAAFQPKKFRRQLSRNDLYCSSLVPQRLVIESPSK